MKFIKIAVICCLVSIAVNFPLEAKSAEAFGRCYIPNVKEAFQNSKAVFVGEVTDVSESGDVKTFTFKVEKYWKGASSKTIEVSAHETMRYQAWFEVGGKYLVFARGEAAEKLWEVKCSRSKSFADASKDIKELGRAKKPVAK